MPRGAAKRTAAGLLIGAVVALVVVLVVVVAVPRPPVRHRTVSLTAFSSAGRRAVETLLGRYYAGAGLWRECDLAACPAGDTDWGYDSMTYTAALAYGSFLHTAQLRSLLGELAASARAYPKPCAEVRGCPYWSDNAAWDAVALADEYLATGDAVALGKARAAYTYATESRVFARGACPSVLYQQPGGGASRLKTLETEANVTKAALLLYRATRAPGYLADALASYTAAREEFLDSRVPLYTVYSFDDGRRCLQLAHRFFASVNGDMIWSGAELARDTGEPAYRAQAVATGQAVARYLVDARGVFVDLQAENDVVEPLVEGMASLAAAGEPFARRWLLRNAAAALGARTADGSFGRFFDGPPPSATTTVWQTNGGLALQVAAAAIAPRTAVPAPAGWSSARLIEEPISRLPASLRFRGAGIALLGTIGERCCERGHARVLVDGRETFDQSGIWQNKSSAGRSIAGSILFAWRWPSSGPHELRFLPGIVNAKEGGPFLRIAGYEVLAH